MHLQDHLYYGVQIKVCRNKRQVRKYIFFDQTQMTRCIHCTRCVGLHLGRWCNRNRGNWPWGKYGNNNIFRKAMESELSANVIDLCQLSLASKPYAFEARLWELKKRKGIMADWLKYKVDTYN